MCAYVCMRKSLSKLFLLSLLKFFFHPCFLSFFVCVLYKVECWYVRRRRFFFTPSIIWNSLFILARLLCSSSFVTCAHHTIIKIPLMRFFHVEYVEIVYINRFTGILLIRTKARKKNITTRKIWYACQWRKSRSNIDWLKQRISFCSAMCSYWEWVRVRKRKKQSHWNSINSTLTLPHTSWDQLTFAEVIFMGIAS